jgi:F0F1-type ATP synthase assembly protein I
MTNKAGDRPSWLRFSGVGIEFVAAIAGFALVGYWVDRHWDTKPWGLVIGAVLGLIGGMYNLIRESLGAFKPPVDRGSRQPPSKP